MVVVVDDFGSGFLDFNSKFVWHKKSWRVFLFFFKGR